MYFKPTMMDLLKMIWWGMTRPEVKPLELPPLKKRADDVRHEKQVSNFGVMYGTKQMAPETRCPHCKRPY